jgi:hypothetical protein
MEHKKIIDTFETYQIFMYSLIVSAGILNNSSVSSRIINNMAHSWINGERQVQVSSMAETAQLYYQIKVQCKAKTKYTFRLMNYCNTSHTHVMFFMFIPNKQTNKESEVYIGIHVL